MNRLEAAAILLCFGVVAVLGPWLIVSGVFGRRRIPERLQEQTIFIPFERRDFEVNEGIAEYAARQMVETDPDRYLGVVFGTGNHVEVYVAPGRTSRPLEAFRWPPQPNYPRGHSDPEKASGEVRRAFADFLAGGPDYCEGRHG